MQFPSFLKYGDAIRVIAPAGAFNRQLFERGLVYLENEGFEVRVSDRVFESQRYFAGSDSSRLDELNQALAEEGTKAIWAARGGYGSGRLLPEVGAAANAEPKWMIGFSDITALHLFFHSKGVGSIHGANITTLESWSEPARQELWGLLRGNHDQAFSGTTFAPGPAADGRVIGGNLTVMASLAGTGQLPSLRGCIVVLEDIGERAYRLDRNLWQLKASGALDGVAGFALGQWTQCESGSEDYTAVDVVIDSLRGLGAPIIGGLDFGHENSSRPLLFGALATLESASGSLAIQKPNRV